jgi:archaellum component FlaC
MDMVKPPSIDTSRLRQSLSKQEFDGKFNDLRKQMRDLSEVVFETKKAYGEIYIEVEKLTKEVERLKKTLKTSTKKED